MMARSVEVLQLENVSNINDARAKMIPKYMPNTELFNIKCFSYKESDNLDNFTNLECLISHEYCPIRIPMTLKVLAFKRNKYAVKSYD
uniref:LRR containing protein n=1 Tax=Strongyloides venezuelensis TaxID=75913 RepID=A0A0K0F4V9_STRVS